MSVRIPPAEVLQRIAVMATELDKPVYFDYYVDSLDKKCCIGVNATEKYLVKSAEEYTSTIQKAVRCESCIILETENSLYVVSGDIQAKKIVSATA
jgi:aminopeptidase C